MNLRQLRQFVTLAETGNFHRAAEMLHMAQPPLSVSIRKLEEEMGEALFERRSTGVFLTTVGEAMLADARLTLFHAEQCRQAVMDARQGQGGLLRMGIIGSATYALLPELIPSLRERFPKIELELTEATSSEILDGLVSRRFDVGFVRYPVLHPAPFELLPMDRDDFVLAVSEHSPLAAHDAIALSDAARQPFIMYPQDKVPGLSTLALMRCQLSGFTPRVAQEAMQVQTIMSLVASGLGVGLVAGVARLVMPRGVKCLALTDNPPGFHVGIALARLQGNTSRLVERFTEHALRFSTATDVTLPPAAQPSAG
ncbi:MULTISPECIES: LysR family transcriptional regulator [unclassified Acidovorax]|uniref:LysR family transcriptional regulator n=1 Tax=unclassified Acidovorax TaxID=2684926 RepID=UPI000BD336F6|nr:MULTISPECIES: LysR family transcriptional regulator [unclassified Acidovorax]OYX12122.1 MAG: LysR family transcriptional regulator [Acidovorax sp. 32-64-7]OZA58485.1 MAG: LysR family transcriptional regulator [Acidovorax sp. 17-64-282]HQS19781.1 LysR substrate-binding domain-containing protein [Acidovorax defluvii]OYY29932.1 MAG: LysR family transcriptional regulator [Acidovorax sp. 35-64-16]OYY86706.1 MAG: LysR family transcriptional regulator [Acidovorax sp. 28-64-14]